MVNQIISASLLNEFIQNNRGDKLVIEFKAEWCQGSFVMKTAFQKFAVRYGEGNMRFVSVDVVLARLEILNSLRADLKLGAFTAFYVYRINTIIDSLITCSSDRLNLFLKSHFIGTIFEYENESIIFEILLLYFVKIKHLIAVVNHNFQIEIKHQI